MRLRPAFVAGGLVALTLAVCAGPGARAAETCRVEYTLTNEWAGGLQGSVAVTNLGSALAVANLTFGFADTAQRVSNGWGGTWTQDGSAVTVSGVGGGSPLPTGTTVTIGFVASRGTANPAPGGFALNGAACTGSGAGTVIPVTTSGTTTRTPLPTTPLPTTPLPTTPLPTTPARTGSGALTPSPAAASPAGSAGSGCPAAGRITYTLARAASPTAQQTDAYTRITAAMDKAVATYNCYLNVTKALNISFNPSVATADGNINGSIRFGATSTMQQITAMHEISHTLGVGTSSAWSTHLSGGVWTGPTAVALLRDVTKDPAAVLKGDSQHFWPYGLNYTTEVTSDADLVTHVKIVGALRADMGL